MLTAAELLGAEVDLRYRVVALTVEPPGAGDADRRLQVLFHPASTIRVLLGRIDDGRLTIAEMQPEHLPDAVAALDGPVPTVASIDGDEPTLPAWSIDGRSDAPDGRSHRFELRAVSEDGRHLVLYATFDTVELRTPAGDELPL
jgi:hypothetical protein